MIKGALKQAGSYPVASPPTYSKTEGDAMKTDKDFMEIIPISSNWIDLTLIGLKLRIHHDHERIYIDIDGNDNVSIKDNEYRKGWVIQK